MNTQLENSKPNEEIDLLELFSRMGQSIKRFFVWLYNLLTSFLLLLIRKSVWIISFSIAGAFVGYSFYQNTPRFYSSQMVAISNSMNNNVIVNSINLLNDLFESKNYNVLANYLSISPQMAEKIKSIGAYYGIDLNKDEITDYVDYDKKYNPKDTTQKRLTDIFYLKISVYDETIFTNVRDGIKKYINTNPYIVENNNVRKQQDVTLIELYKKQIKKLDSLQKVQYFEVPKLQKGGNNQLVLLNEKEIKLYHTDIINLYNAQLYLEKQLILNPDPVTVIQDFTQLAKADNPLIKFLKTWVVIFAIFGFSFSIFWQYRKRIWNLIRNYS